MFKFIRTLLALAHLIALREEQKQVEKQKQFKKKQAARALTLKAEAARAHAKAHALSSKAADANVASTLGSDEILTAHRTAATLRSSLDYVVKK